MLVDGTCRSWKLAISSAESTATGSEDVKPAPSLRAGRRCDWLPPHWMQVRQGSGQGQGRRFVGPCVSGGQQDATRVSIGGPLLEKLQGGDSDSSNWTRLHMRFRDRARVEAEVCFNFPIHSLNFLFLPCQRHSLGPFPHGLDITALVSFNWEYLWWIFRANNSIEATAWLPISKSVALHIIRTTPRCPPGAKAARWRTPLRRRSTRCLAPSTWTLRKD